MSQPPIPKDPEVALRWQHSRDRRHVMEGRWKHLLHAHIRKTVGNVRADAWGEADTSSNILASVSGQLATLYASTPKASHATEPGTAVLDAIALGGLWSLMPRVERDTLGLREYFMRVSVEDDGALSFRGVPPDMTDARGTLYDCDRLVLYREIVERTDPDTGKSEWTWDVFDLRGGTPAFRVMDANENEDISDRYGLGGLSGDAYLERWSDPETNEAIIPAVAYHAEVTGSLYDAWAWSELYAGTLSVGCLWTFYAHAVRDSSFPQRYALNVKLPTSVAEPDTPRHGVVADPSVVLILEALDEQQGQPMIGQWQPGADVGMLAASIASYERKVAAFAGLGESDFARMSGDPRSGYALSISRESARRAARRFEPTFSASDKRLITLCAQLLSRHEGTTYPTTGYAIEYPGPQQTRAEVLAEIRELLDLGLVTRAQAYQMLHPDVSEDQAQAITQRIQAEKAGQRLIA